ncbi:hypothetical protein Q6D67_13405 [Haliea sp. E1-2-M8]|uniref:hypothetical protein n=1 Tax=Haliea sp. E1-2-M8 TaxID=3064706 RepID=UPI0027166631|nr:hypothetical protein [Haliea sp. E1-2-M8]MDO8862702.1 hypothetical protein [Haliea sp. E1-2-M8]
MTRDDLEVVADDLLYLAEWGPEITEREIRHGSAVLRRLLFEGVYGTAWRAIGWPKQPKLIAVSINEIASPGNLSQIVYAIAAGANFRGIQMACMMMNKGSSPIGNSLGPPLRENGYPGDREFSLSEYLSSLSGVVDGKTFNRREVIKYIANVKGGVHLSAKERKSEAKLIAKLGKIEKKIMVHTTDGLLVEFVAIGQALGCSKDAQSFIKHVHEMP